MKFVKWQALPLVILLVSLLLTHRGLTFSLALPFFAPNPSLFLPLRVLFHDFLPTLLFWVIAVLYNRAQPLNINSFQEPTMSELKPVICPECADPEFKNSLGRRDFIRVVGGGVAGVIGASSLAPSLFAAEETAKTTKPAEDLVRELFSTMTGDQKKELVYPWDHGDGNPSRLQTFNGPFNGKRIGDAYTPAQQDLVKQTLKAILSGDDAFERLTRHGKWDNAGSFEGNGAVIFGDPTGTDKFSWVFAGHHLTLRCDGNSEPGAAFGGPMYYGHSANGYSDQNVYNYQTQKVLSIFEVLDEKQREKAVAVGDPGDNKAGYSFREKGKPQPGIVYSELNDEQRELVQNVMRTLIDPFRKEDGDEVMELLKSNGGMEKLHLAFFKDAASDPNERWHYWRLEGPGFVWNYRVLPHVHCFVNIASQT